MPSDGSTNPPGYAWDWFSRQRLVWVDAARRLAAPTRSAAGPHPDVPDWSSLLDAAAIATGSSRGAKDSSTASGSDVRERDWARLQTRADVVAALREDYPIDEAVRHATDAAVRDLAFLARLDVPLEARGVRSVPRGMRWWWTHLGGASGSEPAVPHQASASPSDAEPVRVLPLQLRLTDVMAGYGDGDLPSDLSERTTR